MIFTLHRMLFLLVLDCESLSLSKKQSKKHLFHSD